MIKVDRRPDGIAVVAIDNPPVNALTTPVFIALQTLAESFAAHPPAAVVLTGSSDVFAWGGEFSEIRRLRFTGRTDIAPREIEAVVEETSADAYVSQLGDKYHAVFEAVAAIPRMVVCAIEGVAFGGGLELTLCADYRIASRGALFASPEVTLGMSTIGGGPYRLPRLVGNAQAKRIMLSGIEIDAEEALRIGLIEEVVEPGTALDRAIEFAKPFADAACRSQGLLKRVIDVGMDLPKAEALRFEHEMWRESFRSEEAREGLRKFFSQGNVTEALAHEKIKNGETCGAAGNR
ncbi:enoyl-CoA hydratase/isomerase family protein [Novosphingobium taihuense]|uniref:Enoyl-CoA hydratase/carnithine racemase n=1 Tax=Novosphingobium taihuense TaxID=260085 RepID=A0A7W7ABY5_9SPHN|nr:enoyl-CoA hydratase/isomerase family protein [Novosphingobium taihuense]MBB4613499.1 enoyl-CoA hydratase/carnithine racemase [Novosphingobium taihuense]TWH79978.1 enoyl-CoA hydratase [Novosphingobium taihuense]